MCSAETADPEGTGGSDAGECEWPSGAGASDPSPGPLDCQYTSGHFTITGQVVGSDVELTLNWCGCNEAMCVDTGDVKNLQLSADTAFGTVMSSTLACGNAKATIRLEAGVTEGDIQLTGDLVGRDKCFDPITCPIENSYHVTVSADGVEVRLNP